MSAVARWFGPRVPVLKAIAVGVASWPLAMAVAAAVVPPITTTDRMSFALQLAAVPALLLFAILQSLWRVFDTPQAEDPFAGAESRRYRINCRVMQNTLEQSAMFAPVLIALTVRVPEEHLRWTVVLLSVWTAGRLLFWAGYHIDLKWRAPGMDWTTFTTWSAALWLVSTWL